MGFPSFMLNEPPGGHSRASRELSSMLLSLERRVLLRLFLKLRFGRLSSEYSLAERYLYTSGMSSDQQVDKTAMWYVNQITMANDND